MCTFDKIYKDIVETIDKRGVWSKGEVRTKYIDGTPAYYKSHIGYQFRLDNSGDEAHLITTRPAPYKSSKRPTFDGAKAVIHNFKSIYEFHPDNLQVIDYKHGDKISYEVAI